MVDQSFSLFHGIAYSARLGASVKLNVEPRSPKPKNPDAVNNLVASWGSDNLRPQKIFKSLEGLPQAKQIIQWQAKALYSGGLIYGKEDENGTFVKMKIPEIDIFFRETNIQRYLLEACVDYYWFGNPFTEIGMTNNRRVAWLASQESMFCRKSLQNKKGVSELVFMSADWEEGANFEKKDGIPLIDPYFNRVSQVKDGNAASYMYSTGFPSPGKVFYQGLAWHDLLESGWLDVLKLIPAFKKAFLKNQIKLIYHIEIADWYWEFRYQGQWEGFGPEQKTEKIKETLKEIEDSLSGADNAGKSIKSWMRTGSDGGQESAIKITILDDKIKSGMYVEDSTEAFNHISFSFGVDPTLPGLNPGKGMGAGSGSDKRVAYNIYMLNTKPDMDIILEPVYLTKDINGWDPEIQFMFNNYYIATLDAGKEVTSTGSGSGGVK